MKDKKIENIAFSKHTPSVFLVMTPFQLLCAIEAVHEFAISDYKIVFALSRNYVVRNNQMIQMAEQMSIVYDFQYIDDISQEDFINDKPILKTINIKQRYKRIFIGDYPHIGLHILATLYADNNSILLYLDDGAASVCIFSGIFKGHCYVKKYNMPKMWWDKLSWYKHIYKKEKQRVKKIFTKLKEKDICCSNCFYSIYSDIKTNNYSLCLNTFSYLSSYYKKEFQAKKMVFVVGTVMKQYAHGQHISESELENFLESKLREIKSKWQDVEIVYIPHGRDVNNNIHNFCETLNISYVMPDSPIEFYILKNNFYPLAIYGFGSTALFTIKMIYPQTVAVNWIIDKYENGDLFSMSSKVIADYYALHGISPEYIPYSNRCNIESMGLVSNIKYMITMFWKKMNRVFVCKMINK